MPKETDKKIIPLTEGSTPKELTEEQVLQAEEEDDRLTHMMNSFFNNMSAEEPVIDTMGVDASLIRTNLQTDSGEDAEDAEEEKEEIIATNEITVEEEEVFLIHPDGDITSEAEEAEEAKETIVYRQSLMDRTIYNLAIQEVYRNVEAYRDLLDLVHKDTSTSGLSISLVRPLQSDQRAAITEWLKELSDTQFSLYKATPMEDILLDKIQNKDLKRVVELEIEEQIMKRLGLLEEDK